MEKAVFHTLEFVCHCTVGGLTTDSGHTFRGPDGNRQLFEAALALFGEVPVVLGGLG